jgi:prepilin-type N-terminal cleavage/methylation domain-containing protein
MEPGKHGKRRQGFTLIELMIVIAIIAILAAILIPNFVRSRGESQLAACESNEKNIATSLQIYAADWSGNFPSSLSALTPNYIQSVPICPGNGASYVYFPINTTPVTDYALVQGLGTGGSDPHLSFMTMSFPSGFGSGTCTVCGNCTAQNTPCYIGSQGLVVGH